MTDFSAIDRRKVLLMGGGLAVVAADGTPAFAQKAKPIKVAAIYTVPVEQQWVSRIDKALKAAQARGDVTYKFSENLYVTSPRAWAVFSALSMRETHCCSTGTV